MANASGDDRPGRGWPRGRVQWLIGTVILLGAGVVVGLLLDSLLLGIVLAVLVSIGWLMAYESWRGRTPDLYDEDDNGARL